MNAAYGFSKAGVAQFTRSVAQFGAPLRIRCNSIHPGYTATPILQGLFDKIERDTGITGAMARQRYEELVPLGRLGEALDVAYRSAERRVGEECGGTGRCWGWPCH